VQTQENFEIIVKTFAGLEEVLAHELEELNMSNIQILNRGVSFTGGIGDIYRANFFLRTGLSVLQQIGNFKAAHTDMVYRWFYNFPWEKLFSATDTFQLETTVNSQHFTNSQFVLLRAKDGIVDRFRDKSGSRPSIDTVSPTCKINLHIAEDNCSVSLNSSGEPLFKRGYRLQTDQAPLNEVMAAGMLLLAGYNGETPFVDPMCGSGTLAIEAALIAGNIAPGVFRPSFAFEKWPNFDVDLYTELTVDATDERPIKQPIIGADISPKTCTIAQRNVENAMLKGKVEIVCRDIANWTADMVPQNGLIVTNPPYGVRLVEDDILGLYKQIGATFKHSFTNYNAWVFSPNKDAIDQIGLKSSKRLVLYNGPLQCKYNEYQLYEGTKLIQTEDSEEV
jgi:putative N6-adenine-specific DNA methylase